MSVTIGVDIGGTKVAVGVVDESGRVVARTRRQTPDRSTHPHVVEEVIRDAVEELRHDHEVGAVGVGAAGFVDATGDLVRFAPHLSWREEPLRQRLGELVGLPVFVDNDANAALWAEHRFGAAKGADNAALVTLGTGIGGSLLIAGRLYRGSNGMAGEFGHMQVMPDGRPCECGRRGCWEQYASGKALAAYARAAGLDLAGPALTEAAEEGHPVARGAYAEVGRWLGVGLAGLIAAFDPDVVVIGGGVGSVGELLLAPARAVVAYDVVGVGHRVLPDIVVAHCGADAGLIGAADLARTLL